MTEPITTPPIATAPVPPIAPVSTIAPTVSPAPAPAGAPAVEPVELEPIPAVSGSTTILTSGSTDGPRSKFNIPDSDFEKPLLIHVLRLERRTSNFEPEPFIAPVVNYIVLDPATGEFEEHKDIVIDRKLMRGDLTEWAQKSAYQAVIATTVPTKGRYPAKVLRFLTDQNCGGYTAAQAVEHLTNAAKSLGWAIA